MKVVPSACYFCGNAQLEHRTARVDFRWGDRLVIIDDVPATVCLQCGEQYFDAAVSESMERLALASDGATRRTVNVPVVDFKMAA